MRWREILVFLLFWITVLPAMAWLVTCPYPFLINPPDMLNIEVCPQRIFWAMSVCLLVQVSLFTYFIIVLRDYLLIKESNKPKGEANGE